MWLTVPRSEHDVTVPEKLTILSRDSASMDYSSMPDAQSSVVAGPGSVTFPVKHFTNFTVSTQQVSKRQIALYPHIIFLHSNNKCNIVMM